MTANQQKDQAATKPQKSKQPEKKQDTMPANQPDMRKLNPSQQRVAGFVETAKKDAPKVENVVHLETRVEMEVSEKIRRGPEYEYAWLAIDSLDQALHSGTKWEIVTRSNHSHVDDRFFDLSGAITYKGQNILAFCYKAVRDAEQRAIVDAYNKKTERVTETKTQVPEGEAVRVDPGSVKGRENEVSVLDPSETYDFEAPSE